MLPAPALRIGTLLCVLLVTDMVAASSRHVVSSSAGETVTFSCSDETKKPSNLSDISVIIWRKENGSQSLHFATDNKNSTTSNFTDPRFSFLSAQLPPVLQIRDVRPEDAGNYTCHVSMNQGRIDKSWTLQISESSSSALIYISSSVAGGFVILVLIAGIIYYKLCSKHNTIPAQIHQTSTENTEKEEPIYDNANEDYFLRFNTLYDRCQPI